MSGRLTGWGRVAAAAAVAGIAVAGCVELSVPTLGRIVSVRMTPDTVVLRVGDSARVKAAPLDSMYALRPQELVTWTTSAAGVATVNDTGLVLATGAGSAVITAEVMGVQGTAVVLVTGAPATIAVSAGNGQSAAVNDSVPVPPSVIVKDADGNPVANVAVTFAVASGGGTVSPAGPVVTGLDGTATLGAWVLGPAAGANSVTAMAGDTGVAGNPVTFTATATVGPPSAAMSTVAASPSTIAPSSGLSYSTITVTVRDSAGSTVAGATVSLAATGTGNVLTQPTAPTDAQGRATGTISSSTAETKTISATVNGSVAVTQTAQVVVSANAPAALGVRVQPAGAVSNAAFVTQPVVEIQDAFGNPVPSANGPITVTMVGGDGVLATSGSFTVNAVNGVANFTGLRVTGLRAAGDTLGTGPHVLQFSSPGFNAVRSDTFQVAVSFAYNIKDVTGRNCAGCHSFTVYGNLVNAQASLSCTTFTRVVPSDTTASLVYQKIKTATPVCGSFMPTTGLISTLQVHLIRDWIVQGAPNN